MNVLTAVQRSRFVFPLACVAAVGMMLISEGSYWRSVNSMDALGTQAAARMQIQRLRQSLVDAETGQRGFLLTGRPAYLKPYREALTAVDEAYHALQERYSDKEPQLKVLRKLRLLIEAKLSEVAITIKLYEQGRAEASQELVLSDIGAEKMEAIREASAELLAYESQALERGRGDIYRTLQLSRIGVSALSAISLLALFLYLRQSAALVAQQKELKSVVQAERDRLEIEVTSRTEELTELTRHLLTAREDERSRLARDLHDELGALLTSAKLNAARIKSRLTQTPVLATEALERLAHLVETLNSGIALKRRIIEDLRPSALASLGLVVTLETLASEFAEASNLVVHCALEPVSLSPSADLVVYRLVQEAITNISKHARATEVWITVVPKIAEDGSTWAVASVRDNGVGFDKQALTLATHGLTGMRFRVQAEGGSLNIHSSQGNGVLIEITLPCTAPVVEGSEVVHDGV